MNVPTRSKFASSEVAAFRLEILGHAVDNMSSHVGLLAGVLKGPRQVREDVDDKRVAHLAELLGLAAVRKFHRLLGLERELVQFLVGLAASFGRLHVMLVQLVRARPIVI